MSTHPSSSHKAEAGIDQQVVTSPTTTSPFDSQSSPAGSTLATSMSSSSSHHGDDLKVIHCRWLTCTQTFEDPEDLYQHLCNDHVGRKSTNNLCLSCHWEGCDVTCAKRDHITSHLRVHTPLKPHACDACGKLFKRPQDLKKHERIHTEQHHQARQLKYQANATGLGAYNVQHGMARYGMEPGAAAAAAAAAAYGGHNHPSALYQSTHGQPYGGQGFSASSTGLAHQQMYPALPGNFRHHSPAANMNVYGHTPAETTANSLSPLSSGLGTPRSSNSPAANAAHQRQYLSGVADRSYVGMHHDRPKVNDDPNSYSYLSQGSSLAGSKRSFDATASFFEDVRRKRLAPTYDNTMAERLQDSFAGGIDDATLQAIFGSFDASSQTNRLYPNIGDGSVASSSSSSNGDLSTPQDTTSKLNLPDAFKQTDLAELNAFLLQVGANAARADSGSHHQQHQASNHHPSVDEGQPAFDFQAALMASGLGNIAGFDENLFRSSSDNVSYPTHSASVGDASMANFPHSGWSHRPIAQLPNRANGQTSASFSGQGSSSHMSFDHLRTTRGSAYVPQLGAKDGYKPMYRHVEALTRAAPDVAQRNYETSQTFNKARDEGRFGSNASSPATNSVDEEDEAMDADDGERSSRAVSPSVSSTSSTSYSLYPRMSFSEGARRLPLPSSNERTRSMPSISSILSPDSSSSSSSEESESGRTYPSLPARRRESHAGRQAMEGIERDVAALEVQSNVTVTKEVSRKHARLIIDLLIALNRTGRALREENADNEHPKLAPLRNLHSKHIARSSHSHSRSTSMLSAHERESDQSSDETARGEEATPPPPSRTLPRIRDLLNDVDIDIKRDPSSRGCKEQMMDVEV